MPRVLSPALFVVGLILFSVGLGSYKSQQVVQPKNLTSDLAERDAAINQARKDGKSQYSFTTSFIPGIGVINDPPAYKKTFEEQNNLKLSDN